MLQRKQKRSVAALRSTTYQRTAIKGELGARDERAGAAAKEKAGTWPGVLQDSRNSSCGDSAHLQCRKATLTGKGLCCQRCHPHRQPGPGVKALHARRSIHPCTPRLAYARIERVTPRQSERQQPQNQCRCTKASCSRGMLVATSIEPRRYDPSRDLKS